MSKKRSKPDHQADTRGEPWTGLPQAVQNSVAYRHLSMNARAILLEVIRKFNGYNNGKIGIGYREIGERLNRRNLSFVGPAIAELVDHGLLDVTAAHSWEDSRVREYRLTFISTGTSRHQIAATNDYLHWHPKYGKRKNKKRVTESVTVEAPTVT